MIDDILNQFRNIYNNSHIQFNENVYNVALNRINQSLQKSGNDLSNYANMPRIWLPLNLPNYHHRDKNVNEELSYDVDK